MTASAMPDNDTTTSTPLPVQPPESTVYVFYAPFLEFGFSPTVVLQQFTLHTVAQFYGALGAVAGIAFLFQLISAFKDRLHTRYMQIQRLRTATDVDSGEDEDNCDGCSCMLFLFLTGLHLAQTVCGFFIILIAASFNGWLIGAMIGGSALGYLMGMWKCCCDHVMMDLKVP
ncbi:uncharacterized protein LOC129584485 isoform X2 [Paramacrobiotus metropolitanus]|uniref:uncharacterized protein LOC129584485 isoform X2 n=1 Tax=Paramacrobiotus metropolitanus TaxID=2943436 RepID=UPI0024458281|nr:uncharacterized protein LOC129584485 isoform X2 [Paramacrobiotus metropolitanus]